MENLNEEWRDIKGYEGLYQVSNYGRVKRLASSVETKNKYGKMSKTLKEKILLPHIRGCRGDYYFVELSKFGIVTKKSVHRLVGFAFPDICGEWFEGAEINHRDCDTTNNIATNLEWCTHIYNNNYSNRIEKANEKRRKPIYQFDLNSNCLCYWFSAKGYEDETGNKRSNVTNCCKGKRKSAYGYIWKYAKEGD